MPDNEETSRPSGLRERKRAKTRKQILNVAMMAFNRDGYQATTLDHIAEVAEVHKRTLLRYFPSKAHLVLDRQYAAVEQFHFMLKERDEVPVIDIWAKHVLFHVRKLIEKDGQIDFLRIAASEPTLRQAFLDVQEKYRELISGALEEELGQSFASRIKARVVADALVAGNYSVASMIINDGDYGRLEDAEREVLRLVREGLLSA